MSAMSEREGNWRTCYSVTQVLPYRRLRAAGNDDFVTSIARHEPRNQIYLYSLRLRCNLMFNGRQNK